MDEPQAVESEARQELVVDKIPYFAPLGVVFAVIAADRQNIARIFANRDDIRQANARFFAVLINVFVALQVQINVEFQQSDVVVDH